MKAPIGQKIELTIKYLGFPPETPFHPAESCQYEKNPSSNYYNGFFVSVIVYKSFKFIHI